MPQHTANRNVYIRQYEKGFCVCTQSGNLTSKFRHNL